jgi:predicted ABC-type ATPase
MDPSAIALAGPNGAGKSTTGPSLVRDRLGVATYVDADLLARRSGTSPWEAGRVMIRELRRLAESRTSFAFETTLASRSFAPWIDDLRRAGWTFHLVFLWLPSPDFAVARVVDRVRRGGHAVPEEVVRRRYRTGLRNFFKLYRPLATTWSMYDNSGSAPRLIADQKGTVELNLWSRIQEEAGRD